MTTMICRSLACTSIVITAILNLLVEETVDLVNWGMLHWGLGVKATLLVHYYSFGFGDNPSILVVDHLEMPSPHNGRGKNKLLTIRAALYLGVILIGSPSLIGLFYSNDHNYSGHLLWTGEDRIWSTAPHVDFASRMGEMKSGDVDHRNRNHEVSLVSKNKIVMDHPRSTPETLLNATRTAIICAMARDEVKYLDEWVSYHLAIGFAQIVIWDNSDYGSAMHWWKNGSATTRPEIEIQKDRVTIVPFPNKNDHRQLKAYRRCVRSHVKRQNHTWVAFLDVDEYLVIKRKAAHRSDLDLPNVSEFLAEYCPGGSLGINWLVFGTSNQTNYTPFPLTYRFQYHSGVDDHVKTIVKVSDLRAIDSVHWMKLHNDTMRRDTNGDWIPGAQQPSTYQFCTRLAHA